MFVYWNTCSSKEESICAIIIYDLFDSNYLQTQKEVRFFFLEKVSLKIFYGMISKLLLIIIFSNT